MDMSCKIRRLRRIFKGRWRRFKNDHREGLEIAEDIIGAVSIFVFLYLMYLDLWILGDQSLNHILNIVSADHGSTNQFNIKVGHT